MRIVISKKYFFNYSTSVTVFPVIHIGFLNLFKMANDLSFQEFPVDVDDARGSMNDLEMAISMDGTNPSNDNTNKQQSFWSIDYYQQLFDVDTDKVIHRLLYSMVPRLNSNYVTQNIRPNPDLYGPFWISLTLLFTTAISNQLGNLFAFDVNRTHGVVNFRMITLLAGVVFFYVFMFPLLLLVFSWWRKVTDMYTLVEVICAYGYSLTIYIPITLLWAIRIDWLRWILAFFGLFLSGSVLVISLWPVVRKYKYMISLGITGSVIIMHTLITVILKRSTFSQKLQNFMGYGFGFLCEKRRITIFQNLDSFIGNCPVVVELMASKCGDSTIQYNSSPLHYLIDSMKEASCKFLFVCSLYAYLA
ncbi:Protein YIPF1 [Trichinella murrelli]|uniref:Protein YIPF1 n=1 Tax=Trichinella murrelli TaxID=144512 RepID=A0A0V0UFB9_9BILA|nr:Protein YIPF1 [Trichinella murrelli]